MPLFFIGICASLYCLFFAQIAIAQSNAAPPIKIITSFSILEDLAREIGGTRIEITNLVGAGKDAHDFEPAPADIKRISGAKLILLNGLDFEPWAGKLIKSAAYKGMVVRVSDGITAFQQHHHADPHAWQNILNTKIYVKNIAEALSQIDPDGRAFYAANLARYSAALETLEAETQKAFAEIPVEKRKIITSHDAFGYYSRAYGLELQAPQGLSTASEPSAKQMARLIDQIKKQNIRAIFIENMSNPKLLSQIIKETGVSLSGTLYADALSNGAPAATYMEMMRHNTREIIRALKQ